MAENCCWMQGRLFQLWQCVRDQTEQIEKIVTPPPLPTHFIFIFVFLFFYLFFLLFFAMFCVDMGHYFIFLTCFCLYFLCLQFLGFPI